MRRYLFGALIFTALIVVFVTQNTNTVSIKFLSWSTEQMSLALVLLFALGFGALVMFFVDSIRYITLIKKAKDLKTENKKLKKELNNYKSKETDDSLIKQNNSKKETIST